MEKKKRNNQQDVSKDHATVDMLSILPDSLLLEILSFVDTRLAVQTSILSKRWRNLWRNLPALNFFIKSFLGKRYFSVFINQFLKYHEASTITSLTFHNFLLTQQLFVDCVTNHVNQSLKTIKLKNFFIRQNSSFNFPNLNTLYLHDVDFYNAEWNTDLPIDLFSGLECLENLEIYKCKMHSRSGFVISNGHLRRLTLFVLDPYVYMRKVIISAPRLSSFKLNFYRGLSMDSNSRPHTVYWDINIFYLEFLFYRVGIFFKDISSTKSLFVSSATIKVLSHVVDELDDQICPLDNLDNLKLDVKDPDKFCNEKVQDRVLKYLLSGSPLATVQMIKTTE